jgi:hypothetical protein
MRPSPRIRYVVVVAAAADVAVVVVVVVTHAPFGLVGKRARCEVIEEGAEQKRRKKPHVT